MPVNPSAEPEGATGTVRIPQHVAHRSFDSETVILNLQTSTYHGVNPTGGRMLTLLEQLGSVQLVSERLAEEYGEPRETVARDVAAFCAALAERGLIEITDQA